jgi:hypothetical protein
MDIRTAQRQLDLHALIHPASVFDHPDQVLRDDTLSRSEKRVILSSWASDANAVESQPWLRLIPGVGHPVPLAAILDALRRLDDRDPPPNGGASIRLRSRSRGSADGFDPQTCFQPIVRRHHGLAKSAHQFRSVALSKLRRAHAIGTGRAAAGRTAPGHRS